MKRIVETQDGGFEAVLGERILCMCGSYFYAGKLSGVNADHIELTDAVIVYDTGKAVDSKWLDAEPLPSTWRVMRQSIESWGKAKC